MGESIKSIKSIVTVVGLAGGVLALLEKTWKAGAWVVRRWSDRRWAAAVRAYLAAPPDETPPMPKPRGADFYYEGDHDAPRRLCVVAAARERAAMSGVAQGLFQPERVADGRLVVRLRAAGPPHVETRLNTLRRVYDDVAQRDNMRK
jgi:hypothetical protein